MEDFVDCSWSNDPNPVTIDPELLATASHGIGHDHNGAENDESNDVEGQLLPSWYTGNALAALSNMNALFGNNLTGNLSSSTQPLLGFDNGFDLIQPYPTTGSNDFLPVSSALSISSAAGLLIETFDFSTLQTESTFPSLESVQFELMNPTSTSGIDQISPGTLNPMAFPQWTSSASFSNLGTASWPCDVHHIPALGFCRSDASQLKNIITPPFHDPCPTFLPDVSRTITLPHRCPQPSTNIMAQRNLGMAQDSIPITGFNPACNDSAIVQPSSVCQSQQVVLSPHQIPHSTLHRHHNTTQPTQTTQNPTSTVHADEFAMDNLEELKIIKASGPASRGYNLLPSKRGGKIRKSHSTITTKKPRTIAEKKDVCIRCKWSKLAV
ncbi:hypothetical protein B0J11DRAFT_208698 [Dendryphion nanum]|uniref:Uncharacterized protein n=1 Tax=Dendryphion nanum TaxID=256645 RepID=A0A9P9E4I8_9PLEO|nr:hypothetical protein B0J11DRAFT_208698 [Dendryphion nanum]